MVVVVVVVVVSLREDKQAMKQVLLRSNGHIGYFLRLVCCMHNIIIHLNYS